MNEGDGVRELFSMMFGRDRDRPERPAPKGLRTLVGQVYNGGAMPSVPNRVYLTRPVSTASDLFEGATPTFSVDSTVSNPVLFLGRAPSAGDRFIAENVDGVWVADLGAGSSGCATGTLVFTVVACGGLALPGASVSVTGPGGFSASGTTNGSGQVTFNIAGYPAGSYSWTVSKGVRYATQSGTKTVLCTTTNTQLVSLGAASGYFCMGCCGIPIKTTLNITTPFGGTGTLTLGFLGSAPGLWAGNVTENLPCRKDAGCATQTTAPVTNTWTVGGNAGFSCSGGGFNLGRGYQIGGVLDIEWLCDSTSYPDCPPTLGSSTSFNFVASGPATYTCEPFSLSVPLSASYSPFTGVSVPIGNLLVTE